MRETTRSGKGWVSGAVPALVMVLGLAACGGGSSPTTPGPQPTPPPQPVQFTLNFAPLVSNGAKFTDLQINGNATLAATADWTFASNDVDIYVTSTSCNAPNAEDLSAGRGGCTILGKADSTSAKPERLTMNVSQGITRVWAANFGATTESGQLIVIITPR